MSIRGLERFFEYKNTDSKSVSDYIKNEFINKTDLIAQARKQAKTLSSDLIQIQLDQVVGEVKLIIDELRRELIGYIRKLKSEVENEKSSLVLGFSDEDCDYHMKEFREKTKRRSKNRFELSNYEGN